MKSYYILGIVLNTQNTTMSTTDTIPKEIFPFLQPPLYKSKKVFNSYSSLLFPVFSLYSLRGQGVGRMYKLSNQSHILHSTHFINDKSYFQH